MGCIDLNGSVADHRASSSLIDPLLGLTVAASSIAFHTNNAPWWSWANIVSLDAVVVGLLWQLVFSIQFLGRFPTMPESGIIGLSIWLAYTADRLLDSFKLDRGRPHTLRHRIHFEFRNTFATLWTVVLAIDVILVWNFASVAQMRWGFVAIAVVLAYIVGVHVARPTRRRIPKELQAGLAFAFGASLSCWAASGDAVPLLLSTVMAGLLFAANCLTVACWEQSLDANQGFDSWVTQNPTFPRWLPFALACFLAAAAGMLVTGALPIFVASCLIVSGLLLLLIVLKRGSDQQVSHDVTAVQSPSTSSFAAFADLVLMIPPVLFVTTSALLP